MGSRPWPRVWTCYGHVMDTGPYCNSGDRVKKENQELLLIPGIKNDWA